MKRWLLIAAIFLLAGAVVNVAVAWGCNLAVRGPQRFTPGCQPSDASTTAWWNENKPEGVTEDLAGFFTKEVFGWSVVTLLGDGGGTFRILHLGDMTVYDGTTRGIQMAEYFTAGLPMKSFHGQYWERPAGAMLHSGIITIGSPVWPPYIPIWSGFFINTVFYAAVLWLIPGSFVLRRHLRVRRGLCPKCAYPTGGSAVCSECGRPVRLLRAAAG